MEEVIKINDYLNQLDTLETTFTDVSRLFETVDKYGSNGLESFLGDDANMFKEAGEISTESIMDVLKTVKDKIIAIIKGIWDFLVSLYKKIFDRLNRAEKTLTKLQDNFVNNPIDPDGLSTVKIITLTKAERDDLQTAIENVIGVTVDSIDDITSSLTTLGIVADGNGGYQAVPNFKFPVPKKRTLTKAGYNSTVEIMQLNARQIKLIEDYRNASERINNEMADAIKDVSHASSVDDAKDALKLVKNLTTIHKLLYPIIGHVVQESMVTLKSVKTT